MKIVGTLLANRFYVRDGWTRQAVAELLNDPRQELVTYRDDRPEAFFQVCQHSVKGHVAFIKELISKHTFISIDKKPFESQNKVVEGAINEERLVKTEVRIMRVDIDDETIEVLIPAYRPSLHRHRPINFNEFSLLRPGVYLARVNIDAKRNGLKIFDWDFESYRPLDRWETL